MRATYRVLAHSIAGLVAVQAAAIALWVFGLFKWVDDGNSFTPQVADDRAEGVTGSVGIAIHSFGAIVIALLAIALVIVSFFAKFDGAAKWAGFVFLAVLLQWVFAIVAFEAPVAGVLHGLNAIVVFSVALQAGRRVGALPGTTTPTEVAATR
jgi:hypothetical protein